MRKVRSIQPGPINQYIITGREVRRSVERSLQFGELRGKRLLICGRVAFSYVQRLQEDDS